MSSGINYLHGTIAPQQEKQALHDLGAYLVAKGKYKDGTAALKDAAKRVAFLEKADVYADDPKMVTASPELKSIHALIAGHHLHEVLDANAGYLPEPGQAPPSPPDAAVDRGEQARKDPRTLTNVFGTIDFDIRAGLSREQILTKLQDNGLSEDNAIEAYTFVRKQRQKKQQTRLVAALTIIVLTVILYFVASRGAGSGIINL